MFLLFVVAGVGLEPHDLRVMSPTSYQLLYPAVFGAVDGNRTRTASRPRDFKSLASASSATTANPRSACLLYAKGDGLSTPARGFFYRTGSNPVRPGGILRLLGMTNLLSY